jgi:hypothetical protein
LNDKLADMLGEEWRGIWDKEHRSAARTIHAAHTQDESEGTEEDEDVQDEE